MITIKRGSSKRVRLQWFEGKADASDPIDCTGMTCLVQATDLPWTPAIVVIDAAQGEFDMILATRTQSLSEDVGIGRTYEVTVALEQPGDEGLVPDQNIGVQFA